MNGRALVLDHRDSFIFNLVEELRRAGLELDVLRTSASLASVQERVRRTRPDLIVLSPGPGAPEAAGVMVPLLRSGVTLPLLGVCLGMQAFGIAAGGRVARAPALVHGRATPVHHTGDRLFEGIERTFPAGRYHSLAVLDVPSEYEVIATADTPQGPIPMALRHRELLRIGLQFHPESILTPAGPQILANFLAEVLAARDGSGAAAGVEAARSAP